MPELATSLDQAAPLWLHRAVVRPEWVDYNGHMNEAYYVLVFGDATDALYDHIGLDDAARRRDSVSLYTVEAHIRYLIEAHEGEELRIGTRILAHDEKRLRLHHTMVRERDGETLAVIELMALHVDKRVVRACPFLPAAAARIASVAGAQAALPPPVPAESRHWASHAHQA
ncbi:MAG: thioesterase family protein [Rhodospirillales bacterium]